MDGPTPYVPQAYFEKRLDRLETKIDQGFSAVDGRLDNLEKAAVAQAAARKVLVRLGAAGTGVVGVVTAVWQAWKL